MTTVAILFWAGVFLVFYTYLGYGILLWLLVKIREAVHPARRYAFPADPPEVTLLIAAYNEQEVVAEKMANCRALDYPAGKLRVTDHRRLDRPHRRTARRLPRGDGAARPAPGR